MKNKFKEIREKKGETQKDCANRLGITLRAWQSYEQGISEPKFETLCKLADFYGVSTDYLLGRTDIKTAPDAVGDDIDALGMEIDEEEILRQWLSYPDDVRKKVLDTMLDLAEAVRRVRAARAALPPIITITRLHRDKAAAGDGFQLGEGDEWRTAQVYDDPAASRYSFAVEVSGDSMLPEYEDGDIVFVDAQQQTPLGGVGVFRRDGRGYIKKRGEDRLISLNPAYPDIFPDGENIEELGRVIGKTRKAL